MTEDLIKAYSLVEQDLRRKVGEVGRVSIDIYPGTPSGVRLHIGGFIHWSGCLKHAVQAFEEEV